MSSSSSSSSSFSFTQPTVEILNNYEIVIPDVLVSKRKSYTVNEEIEIDGEKVELPSIKYSDVEEDFPFTITKIISVTKTGNKYTAQFEGYFHDDPEVCVVKFSEESNYSYIIEILRKLMPEVFLI